MQRKTEITPAKKTSKKNRFVSFKIASFKEICLHIELCIDISFQINFAPAMY